jgi:hypothetical protein
MSESQTLIIQLSPEESARLEAEAKRLNVPADALALMLLQLSLAQVNPSIDSLAALWRLHELTQDVTPIDPVELVRVNRENLEKRGVL